MKKRKPTVRLTGDENREKGTDPAARLDRGLEDCDCALIRGAIEAGADPNREHDGTTPLFEAAIGGAAGLVELLLARGARIDWRDEDGRTPLHAAAKRGRVEVVKRLLAAGADAGAKDGEGRTPRDVADEAARGVLP